MNPETIVSTDVEPLFQPLRVRGLTLSNRIVMAPMTRSFSPGGVPGADVAAYYRRRAEGGSGLLINAGVKEHWGRARPIQVSEFGGHKHFSLALVPADQCDHNCSFVSGHAASGFVLMAVGLMGSVATRRRWFWIGMAWGAVASLMRIAQGGHFLSDTLFAGVAIWGSGWIVRELWLRATAARWRRLRRRREAAAG